MAKQPPIISAKPPEDSESRYHPDASDDAMECPACGDVGLEFIHFFWDDNGHQREHWVCDSCGLEVNC